MHVIKIEESSNADITAVMLKVKCPHCNSSWGIYLNEDKTYPKGWDVCLKCLGKETYIKNVKENEKYGEISKY